MPDDIIHRRVSGRLDMCFGHKDGFPGASRQGRNLSRTLDVIGREKKRPCHQTCTGQKQEGRGGGVYSLTQRCA